MSGDSRKEFILASTGNFYGLSVTDGVVKNCHDEPALNNFLDDGNVSVLCAIMDGKKIVLHNKVYYKFTLCLFHNISIQIIE